MRDLTEIPGLRLRPLEATDAPRIAAHCADLEVTRWLSRVPHPSALADAEACLASVEDGVWATEAEGVPGLIGVVGPHAPEERDRLGHWLARLYWGRGLMSRAARVATDAFFEAGGARLASGAFEGNAAPVRIQRTLGFEITGRRQIGCRALGRELTHIDTALDRAGWRSGWEAAR